MSVSVLGSESLENIKQDFDFSDNSPTSPKSPHSPFRHSKKPSASYPYNYHSRSHSALTLKVTPDLGSTQENSNPSSAASSCLNDADHTENPSDKDETPTGGSHDGFHDTDHQKNEANASTARTSFSHISSTSGDELQDTNGDGEEEESAHNQLASQFANAQVYTGYPFLRAVHAFDASSLVSDETDPEEDPANICLSFQESEVVLLHSIHPSGWGDATILSSGVGGWIPTNYFTPYTDPKITPLLSAVLNFVVTSKSEEIPRQNEHEEPRYTFSQLGVTNIVAGVRALLEACGTLTRDTPIIQKSQAIKKFRKILLSELAILVSLAKEHKGSTEDSVIDKLVSECYKIVSRAVVFLDIWTIDTSNNSYDEGETSVMAASSNAAANNANGGDEMSRERSQDIIPDAAQQERKNANRESVIFHKSPPFAKERLNEVNDALTSYLGNFIHRMTILESDPSSSAQILINTRKSMLACRELLAAVESISAKSLPRQKELENSKDLLFEQIRMLVTAARDAVSSSNKNNPIKSVISSRPNSTGGNYSPECQLLIDIATDCAKTSGECVVRCKLVLDKIGDFQLSHTREYPDFSDGVIAVSDHRKRSSISMPAIGNSSTREEEDFIMSPSETSATPMTAELSDGFTYEHSRFRKMSIMEEDEEAEELLHVEIPLDCQVVLDDSKRVRGGSLDGLVKVLTDESFDQDPLFMSAFFLTFRQFSNSIDFSDALVKRYAADTDEHSLSPTQVKALLNRRIKVYNMIKIWMECFWKPVDVVVLPQIVNFANSHLTAIPEARLVLNELAGRVQQLPDGEVINRQFIPISGALGARQSAVAYGKKPAIATTVTKNLASMLVKAISHVEGDKTRSETPLSPTEEESKNGVWSNSLRMVKVSSGASVTILDIDPGDIARQLCLIDNSVFCKIKPDELLDLNFSMKRRHLGLAPNVVEMASYSNHLSAFVGDTVLGGDHSPKIRRNILKQWIKIAEKCNEYQNFNSLMAITSALQSVNILRLKKTWDLVSPKYIQIFSDLKSVVAMDKNYATYRGLLRKHEIPCVPYLGLYLTDLTFVMEGNPVHRPLFVDRNSPTKILPPGQNPNAIKTDIQVINFDRYERTVKIIGEVQIFQVPYRMIGSPELQAWLKVTMSRAYHQSTRDHNILWRRSCIIEPKS